MSITYAELTGRNAGFVTEREQARLREASVLVVGVGGMGGVATQTLARVGIGRLTITDPDCFEASNLNRQPFAFVDTLGAGKAAVTREALGRINPTLEVEVAGDDWVEQLGQLLRVHPVVVNGMDDLRAGIQLYREAREHGATVIDAYTSPYPSVTCVAPFDPRPEERLGFPTVGVPAEDLTPDQLRGAYLAELRYVGRVSSGIERLEPDVVEEIIGGQRPRSSFCPLVTIAGSLMAFEAIGAVLGRPSGAGCEGYFLDPWAGRVERPGDRVGALSSAQDGHVRVVAGGVA